MKICPERSSFVGASGVQPRDGVSHQEQVAPARQEVLGRCVRARSTVRRQSSGIYPKGQRVFLL